MKKLFRNPKAPTYRLNQPAQHRRQASAWATHLLFILVIGGCYLVALRMEQNQPATQLPFPTTQISALPTTNSLQTTPLSTNKTSKSKPNILPTIVTPASAQRDIITTIFWVGEPADSDNGYIANTQSAWDEHWEAHYGGFDDPNARNGYMPNAFTPKENPFYVALPYNDFGVGSSRKATASGCLPYTPNRNDHYSWCKNIWVAVTHGTNTVYAQWEDVGPFEEDDASYVFGTSAPKNTLDAKAGLDVSPAVRDYLKLNDVDHTSWSFVSANAVPDGPWKLHVTNSLGSSID